MPTAAIIDGQSAKTTEKGLLRCPNWGVHPNYRVRHGTFLGNRPQWSGDENGLVLGGGINWQYTPEAPYAGCREKFVLVRCQSEGRTSGWLCCTKSSSRPLRTAHTTIPCLVPMPSFLCTRYRLFRIVSRVLPIASAICA